MNFYLTLKSGTPQDKVVQGLSLSKTRPAARVITGSPCFTVKPLNDGSFGMRDLMACGTEKGRFIIADYSPGFEYREYHGQVSKQDLETLKRAYYINFPQCNQERINPNLLLPCVDVQVHTNSIFDLIWINQGSQVVTASGDQNGVVVDVETQQIIKKLADCHEASIKCLIEVPAHPNVIATGGREGRIALNDLRCNQPQIIGWRNTAQQILSKRGPQNISITGLACYYDQLISCDSNSDKLAFFDLRKTEQLVFVCNLEQSADVNTQRKGSTSLQCQDNKLVVNNMCNQILTYNLNNLLEQEPLMFMGHKSSFFTKASMYNNIVACGSQDTLVYLWSSSGNSVARLGSDDRLYGHLHEVNEVSVCRRHVLSSSDDASVLVWHI